MWRTSQRLLPMILAFCSLLIAVFYIWGPTSKIWKTSSWCIPLKWRGRFLVRWVNLIVTRERPSTDRCLVRWMLHFAWIHHFVVSITFCRETHEFVGYGNFFNNRIWWWWCVWNKFKSKQHEQEVGIWTSSWLIITISFTIDLHLRRLRAKQLCRLPAILTNCFDYSFSVSRRE